MLRKTDIFKKIIEANLAREKSVLSEYACASADAVRLYPAQEKIPDRRNIRPAFFHDTDRIIHSQAYARYIDKTQVFYLFENDHITHRVLHVQFVAKIGRVIGRALRLNEDLIEAIALGHDIGHVPYGHDGEKVLDKICHEHKIGSFCHNVQSVRFLKDIEKNGQGLNLTLQVLDGILAHNGEMFDPRYEPDRYKNWSVFQEEYQKCFSDRAFAKKIRPMTLEGCVVRISDIIAYIGRDIEDAITVRLTRRSDIPPAIRKVLGNYNNQIINTLVMDLIANSYGRPYLEFSKDVFRALRDLRKFNHENIYFNPQIKTQSIKIEDMFVKLFDKYCHNINYRDKDSFTYRYWRRMGDAYRKRTPVKRAVADFIAGMTDDFFNNQFNQTFVPQSFGYVFKPQK